MYEVDHVKTFPREREKEREKERERGGDSYARKQT
jgi:hypothetical protein